jgi:hypothetical protein
MRPLSSKTWLIVTVLDHRQHSRVRARPKNIRLGFFRNYDAWPIAYISYFALVIPLIYSYNVRNHCKAKFFSFQGGIHMPEDIQLPPSRTTETARNKHCPEHPISRDPNRAQSPYSPITTRYLSRPVAPNSHANFPQLPSFLCQLPSTFVNFLQLIAAFLPPSSALKLPPFPAVHPLIHAYVLAKNTAARLD